MTQSRVVFQWHAVPTSRLGERGMEPTFGRSPEALATAAREKWGPVVKWMAVRLD